MASVRFMMDPDAVLDFTLDWTDWLVDGDSIVEVSFSAPAPLELTSETFFVRRLDWAPEKGPRHLTQVWVRNPAPGSTHTVTCHIRALSGREDDRSFDIFGREK